MEEIKNKVVKIISEKLGKKTDDITLESHFVNDLNLDSLDTVEIIMAFEKEFAISIPDDEAEKIRTVGDVVSFIEKNISKK